MAKYTLAKYLGRIQAVFSLRLKCIAMYPKWMFSVSALKLPTKTNRRNYIANKCLSILSGCPSRLLQFFILPAPSPDDDRAISLFSLADLMKG